jgi:uncharacterized protein YdaU (DUF1376 family)
LNYYRRFPGDYTRDTRHLTLEQHGAYTLLLDHCYSTESAIISVDAAMKICAAMSKRERLAVNFVLENFFELTVDGYANSRVQKEINYTESISNVRRQAANCKHKRHANADQLHVQMPAIPDSKLQTPKKEEVKRVSPTELGSPEFLEFWDKYPRKVGRLDALKAWCRGRFDGLGGEILAGLEVWKQSKQWQDSEYVPYPATWLENRRWKELPEPSLSKAQQKARNTDAAIERYKQRPDYRLA